MIQTSNIFESYEAELIKLWFLIQSMEKKNPNINGDYISGKINNSLSGQPLVLQPPLERRYLEYRAKLNDAKNNEQGQEKKQISEE